MKAFKLSEDLKPLSDLKSHAAEVVRQVEETGRPVVITRHGRGVAVVMSLETFEGFCALEDRLELFQAVHAAEEDVAAGRLHSQAEVESRIESRLAGLKVNEG
jgi:antitoxin YefM